MRYYCVQDCFVNKQYFNGGRFYEGYDIERGIEPGDEPGEAQYLVPTSPPLREPREPKGTKEGQAPTEKQRDDIAEYGKAHGRWEEVRNFIGMAINDADSELRGLKVLMKKGTVRGLGARMKNLEERLRELRAA